MQATMQAAPCVSTPSGSTVVQRLAAGSGGATRTTRLPEACAMELAASAFATALTSNRPSSAMVRASAAARRDDAVAVAVPATADLAASVSYVQGRSGSWIKGQRCGREGRGGMCMCIHVDMARGGEGTRLDEVG